MNPLHWIDTWSVASQQRARRNAMIASTALAQRRAETDAVEDFLADLQTAAPAGGHAARRVAAHG
jgi:hypothetical protein